MAALKVIAMLFTDSGIKDKIVHVAECGRIQHLSQKQTGGETRSCPWSLTSKTRSTTPHRNAAGAFNKGAADSDVSERDRYGGIQLQMASKWPASAFCPSTQCIQLSKSSSLCICRGAKKARNPRTPSRQEHARKDTVYKCNVWSTQHRSGV